ncbi:MAG: sugar phosphate isomerase/epimerase [Clostridiaceae bacterium]|jgi:sugar phosphate isomerase/epimerase|nr:sugar phosphate isomerase/epimerase [Clostridiaceae bacterium]
MAKFVLSGFSDEIGPDLDVQLRELRKNDITRMEMRFVNGKNVVEHSLLEMKEIKKQLDASGVLVSAVGSPIGKINITDPFGSHFDLFKHTMEIAGVLGTKTIRMFSFYIPEGEDPGTYRNEVLERWSSFTEVAKGTDIILAHENEKGIYGDTADRCVDIIEAMNSKNVRAVFDPANFVQCDVQTYPNAYQALKPYIAYMHIKDALSGSGKVVPAGFGDGKLHEILADIGSCVDGEMVLSLEPHLGSFEGLAGLEKQINITTLEESGPGKFEVAVRALKKLLNELEQTG